MGLIDRTPQSQRYGLLSPDVMSLIQSGGPRAPAAPAAPARPQRGRVNGLRVAFDALLGNGDPFESLDRERTRLEAEANRPQMEARMAQMRATAQQMGPAAMIAFETNPEKFGESLAEQYAPQVIAAGGVQSVIGNGQRVSAPRDTEFGDSLVRTDPLSPTPEVLMRRGPTFAEETGRINANNPINVAAGGRAVDPRTGRVIAEGYIAPEVVSTPAGGTTNVIDPRTGQVVNSIQGNAKPLTAMDRRQLREDQDAIRTAEEITSNLDNLIGQIDRGDLNLGPVTNMLSAGRNASGMSNENSRNFASFRASLEKLRNDSLRLNTGVQTDGDSRRAWDELVANINDERVVAQRLAEIRDINRRAIEYRQARIADASSPSAPAPSAGSTAGPIAEDGQGNRIQWNGSAWVPM